MNYSIKWTATQTSDLASMLTSRND